MVSKVEVDAATLESLKKQITLHTRRLNVLKELKAIKGINTQPEIILEIEDIEVKVEKLRKQLIELDQPKKIIRSDSC